MDTMWKAMVSQLNNTIDGIKKINNTPKQRFCGYAVERCIYKNYKDKYIVRKSINNKDVTFICNSLEEARNKLKEFELEHY